MKIKFLSEFEIGPNLSKSINSLLKVSFADTEYYGRDFFKQRPHHRFLAFQNCELIAQLAVDFRAMNLNGEAINVMGVIDLCVHPEMRGQGIASKLLNSFEDLAKKNSSRIDFLFLVTDIPKLYEKLGYIKVDITTSWYLIDNLKNYGVRTEKIDDAYFLVKSISAKKWVNGNLDLLGYMY